MGENMRHSYEDKLDKASFEFNKMREMLLHYQQKTQEANIFVSEEFPEMINSPRSGEVELRKDLKKARHQLKQYESRIKNIEEEHKQQLSRLNSGKDKSPKSDYGFKTQFELLQKQVEKERQEYKRRLEKLETENDNVKSERNSLLRNVEQLNSDKDSLISQCSEFKSQLQTVQDGAQLKAIEDEDDIKDQLFKTIDRLTAENAATKIELDFSEESTGI